jgi:SAM-dependent methyltransferase
MQQLEQQERSQFDLDHGVNTATPLGRMAFNKLVSTEKGSAYQASWTSEIRTSFQQVHEHLGDDLVNHSFIDVGCGKGKVNLVWQQELDRRDLSMPNLGIDYYEPLLTIARNNWKQLYPKKKSQFYLGDAASYDFRRHGEKLVLYMFNPFSALVLLQMIRGLKGWPTVLIYNVPTCDQIVRASKFTAIHSRRGVDQNQQTVIYKNY